MPEPVIIGARKRAWETRRAKYGPRGHGGSYSRSSASSAGMLALIIRMHVEGTLSEGQVARATGLHRIAIRELARETLAKADAEIWEDRPVEPEET